MVKSKPSPKNPLIVFICVLLVGSPSLAQSDLLIINHTTLTGKIAVVVNGILNVIDLEGATQEILELDTMWIGIEDPEWSPTEAKIVFIARYFTVSDSPNPTSDIFVINADGSNLVQLTTNIGINSDPEWTPDGQEIVFKSIQAGVSNIFSIDLNGTNLTKLSNFEEIDWNFWDLDLSPDGQKIAFVNDREYRVPQPDGTFFSKSTRVSLVELNNGKIGPITDVTNGNDCGAGDFYRNPTWFLDGKIIAVSFGCAPDTGEIYLIEDTDIGGVDSIYDASKLVVEHSEGQIINGFGWSPDGDYITFVDTTSNNSGKTYTNLYAINLRQNLERLPESVLTITANQSTQLRLASPSWVQ